LDKAKYTNKDKRTYVPTASQLADILYYNLLYLKINMLLKILRRNCPIDNPDCGHACQKFENLLL